MKCLTDTTSFLVKGDKLYDVTHKMLSYRNYCVLTKSHSMLSASVVCKKVIGNVSVQDEHICNDYELYNYIIDNINEYIFLNGFSRTEVQKLYEFIITEKKRLQLIAALDDTKNKNSYIKKPFTRSRTRNK